MVPKQSPALQYEAESPWIEWWVTHKGLTIHPLMPCGLKTGRGNKVQLEQDYQSIQKKARESWYSYTGKKRYTVGQGGTPL